MTLTPEPIPSRRSGTPWRAIAEALRAAPGIWHALSDVPRTSTTDIRRGGLAFAPAGAFDAQRRAGKLYVRYVGEPSPPWWSPITGLYLGQDPNTPRDEWQPVAFDDLHRDPDYTDTPQP